MASFRFLKEAEAVVGGLSNPSKMPGYAYSLPAWRCQTGSQLRALKGSVCSKCYAMKGRYVMPTVRKAMERRFASLSDPRWVEAMVFAITGRCAKVPFFRWHDSGDIQGLRHLDNIVEVCRRCPQVRFWLPTRELKYVQEWQPMHGDFPTNLVVRVSGAMIDGPAPVRFIHTSTVTSQGDHSCPAYTQGGACGDCRACWNPEVRNVSYPRH